MKKDSTLWSGLAKSKTIVWNCLSHEERKRERDQFKVIKFINLVTELEVWIKDILVIFSLRTALYNRQLFIRIAVVNGIDVMSLSENLLSHGFENRDDSFLLEFLFYFFFWTNLKVSQILSKTILLSKDNLTVHDIRSSSKLTVFRFIGLQTRILF